MSIVNMQRMSLVAHNNERSKLLRIFIKLGCVELIKSEDIVATDADRERREKAESKKFRVAFAMSFLREMSKEMLRIDKNSAPKINLKKENRLIPLEEYEEVCHGDIELFSKIDEMESINNRIVDMRSEKTRLLALREQLNVFRDLSISLDKAKNTESVAVFVGTIPAEKLESFTASLPEDVEAETYGYEKIASVAVISHISKFDEINEILTNNDFIKTSLNFNCTAAEKIAEIDARTKEIDAACNDLIRQALTYANMLPTLKIVYDYYMLELAKIETVATATRTKKAMLFEAWVPADKVDVLTKEIDEKCKNVEIFFRDPLDDENPPTLIKTNKVVGAFAGITDMFGRPNYRERDPNLFVAFFYFLIFGIMIGDAGYGLIMAIACFTFLKIKKPVKNSGQMITMFAFCGISTLIWGILFGGWFAIEIPAGSFLSKLTWFNPLNEPLKMFMLSLGVGVLQIGTGFALNGIAKIKAGFKYVVPAPKKAMSDNALKARVFFIKLGKAMNGILSDFGWVVIFIGLLLISPNIMIFLNAIDTAYPWFAVASKIGMYTAIVGGVMIVIGGAWGKKNPIKMVGGALGSVYGGINIVSDLLSYSRLFGLGLTTGVIGLVMNKLGMILIDLLGSIGIGWIFAIVIFVGGHAFNLAINLLGAYVHDSRLQYIEFFGRFYDGSGHAFKPIGANTKYTYLDN